MGVGRGDCLPAHESQPRFSRSRRPGHVHDSGIARTLLGPDDRHEPAAMDPCGIENVPSVLPIAALAVACGRHMRCAREVVACGADRRPVGDATKAVVCAEAVNSSLREMLEQEHCIYRRLERSTSNAFFCCGLRRKARLIISTSSADFRVDGEMPPPMNGAPSPVKTQ
jgi:hypothetical protein